MIEALPAYAFSDDEKKISEARNAYDALSEEQKKLIPTDLVEKLKSVEKDLADAIAYENRPPAAVVGKTYIIKKMKYKVTLCDPYDREVVLVGTTIKKSKLKKLTIPDSVEINGENFWVAGIGNNAFKGYKKLKKVTIPRFAETIGKKAFYGDKNLKTITIRSAFLKKIGKGAIKGIYKKATIKVPKDEYEDMYKPYKKLFKKSTGFTKKMKLKRYNYNAW